MPVPKYRSNVNNVNNFNIVLTMQMMSKSTITEFVTRDPYQWKITFEWVDNLLATSFVPLILVGTFANTRSAAMFFVNRKYVKLVIIVIN